MGSQEGRDSIFKGSDSRTDFKQIVAKRSDLLKQAPGRLVTPGADTDYPAGTVLAQITTAGPNLSKWVPYDDGGANDGTNVARGVLAEAASADTAGDGTLVNVIVGGTLYSGQLIGLDAAALVDLKAKQYVENGDTLLDF